MAAIHHATLKRAAKAGIVLTQDGNTHVAHWPKLNKRLVGENPKYLLEDMIAIQLMDSDYKSFRYEIQDDEMIVNITVLGTDISVSGLRANAAFEQAKKAWEESRAELDIDDEEADDEVESEVEEQIEEEDGPKGSVVSERYRAKYAEMGHPTNCGDWLATTLINLTVNKEGTNVELLEAICELNGVSLAKYKRVGTGWQGRLRMTARNILARIIWLAEGKFVVPETLGGVLHAPADWLASKNYKRPKPAAAPVSATPQAEAAE